MRVLTVQPYITAITDHVQSQNKFKMSTMTGQMRQTKITFHFDYQNQINLKKLFWLSKLS